MRTVKKPEIRKQEILDGALAVFLEKGYEKTTISDIAQALKISQGLCYRYFASKEEIYNAVIQTYAAMIAGKNLEIRPEHQPIRQWVDSIPGLIRIMRQAEQEDPQMYDLLHRPGNEKLHTELCFQVVQKMIPAVTGVLEKAKEQGQIQIEDCRKTAVFGLYGELGLLMSEGTECGGALKENWQMLLGIHEKSGV